ncbi:MAG: nucleotidyltransferase domain-containing protein, partial [Candidatus Eisenbacteria bacterium]
MPQTRQAVLAAVLLSPKRAWYRSDLARHLGVAPSSLTRELAALTTAGLLRRRTEGRQVYFEANSESPLYPDLRSLLTKTVGLVDVLRNTLFGSGRQATLDTVAFVYGSWARGEQGPTSDVDVFMISERPLSTFAKRIHDAERQLGRPVN